MTRHICRQYRHEPAAVWIRSIRMNSEVNLLVVFNLLETINQNFFLWRNWTRPQSYFMIHRNFIDLIAHCYKIVEVTEAALPAGHIVSVALKHFIQNRRTNISAVSLYGFLIHQCLILIRK